MVKQKINGGVISLVLKPESLHVRYYINRGGGTEFYISSVTMA